MRPHFRDAPQWITGSRLLRPGESITFHLYRQEGLQTSPVVIFPRYLEQAEPGERFVPGALPHWLDGLKSETHPLRFVDGCATMNYTPDAPGNYIARWQAGDEIFYRYFSVTADNGVVLNFSTFGELESAPALYGTGIPLDHRLPIERFDPEDALFQRLLMAHRCFGYAIVPAFPDTPSMSMDERIQTYGRGLETVRALMPDANEARSARIDMFHDRDPGYTETLTRLGVNDHCGLWEANANPWLGMPEFPYFASSLDCRKARQEANGPVVAHQWDFCGGWHFLGPLSWHYGASAGQWERTERCLRQGMAEARNLATMSGHPAFLTPLYDGVNSPNGFANGQYDDLYRDREGLNRFVERYQRFMAFDMTRAHPLVFARSIDIVDYYRRRFTHTPRTVFVSSTDHILYDMWWLCEWYNRRNLLTRERIPWETRISSLLGLRDTAHPYKDPLSSEYILVEDYRRSIRFERECPNPIWWFDYTAQTRDAEGSAITHTVTPDTHIVRSPWTETDEGWTITLNMKTTAVFNDYAIALWDVPAVYDDAPPVVATNAKEAIVARNTRGEVHLVLCFDLAPDVEIRVTIEKTS